MTDKKKAAEKKEAERDAEAAARAAAEAEAAEEALADVNQTSEFATGDGAAAAPEDRVAALEAETATLKDQLLRALAESENVRRRAQRDREDAARYAAAPLIKDLIEVADNLRRALDAVPADAVEADEHLKTLMTGVQMTERALQSVFERHHIRRIDPLGERLDPHAHEAMFEVPDPSQPAGTVVQVLRPGYRLHDRLLRAAQVGVAKGGPAPGAKANGGGERREPGSRVDTTA